MFNVLLKEDWLRDRVHILSGIAKHAALDLLQNAGAPLCHFNLCRWGNITVIRSEKFAHMSGFGDFAWKTN